MTNMRSHRIAPFAVITIGAVFALTLFSPRDASALLFAARIDWVDPVISSQYTESIVVKGSGWGPYDDRGEPNVFLAPIDDESAEEIQLVVERNYRDCSFVVLDNIRGSCAMDEGDMLLRVSSPKNLKEGYYRLAIVTTKSIEAAGLILVVRLPDFRTAKRPIAAVNPTSGPVGSPALFTVGGFPKRTGLFIRFDDVKLPGVFYTDENGFIAEAEFTVPKAITKNSKVITITPGKHTIEINDGAGLFQKVTFTVTEEEEPKKEEPKKEEPKKEEPKKEEPKKEEPKKEEPKKEEPKKEDKPFMGKPCDANLPRSWQEGCVSPADQLKEQKPQTQLYAPDSAGKPCKEGIAITFQPGCVSQAPKAETVKPFAGKPCDANLPRSWQEGCISAQKTTQTTARVTIKAAELPLCNPSIPTYTQTNCRKE